MIVVLVWRIAVLQREVDWLYHDRDREDLERDREQARNENRLARLERQTLSPAPWRADHDAD